MPSASHILSMLGLVALPLVNSLPNHLEALLHEPGITNRNRAQVMDVSMLNFAPWNITDLHILCNRPNTTADYTCNLTYHVFDPNSVRENKLTSGDCQIDWSWDGHTHHNADGDGSNPVVGYRPCVNDQRTFIKSSVVNFWHPGNFTIEVVHHYHDNENFTYPWDYPTTFAHADILICEEQALQNTMEHRLPSIDAPVVGCLD
ncbi:uncharacterized protein B0T15DRAFT_301686 [Chaetomium strumarium]|uniref:AA1-like domain-containing protein n=1 Tax=Chaetomium strumarium TaxID=1170767 RepID=A0AAJ0GLX4_9PEZI|nr:hypothetical protein B0T15DRAFT_301686 [Chaetomium strumarium]